MKEEVINFGENLSLVGVLTYLTGSKIKSNFAVIFFNAGIIHKIGPNGIYVNIARELAKIEVSSFRFDFSGLGDSDIFYDPNSQEDNKVNEIKQAIDLVQQKIKVNNFILIGICSGAEDAFEYSFKDERIKGLLLIDGIYIDEKLIKSLTPIARKKCAIRYYKKNIFSVKKWIELVSSPKKLLSKAKFSILFVFIISKIKNLINNPDLSKSSNIQTNYGIEKWENMLLNNMNIYLLFCEGGIAIDIFKMTVYGELTTQIQTGLLKMDFIKNVDHTFTPIWAQELLKEKIIRWIEPLKTSIY